MLKLTCVSETAIVTPIGNVIKPTSTASKKPKLTKNGEVIATLPVCTYDIVTVDLNVVLSIERVKFVDIPFIIIFCNLLLNCVTN